jgi:hypothetical protein
MNASIGLDKTHGAGGGAVRRTRGAHRASLLALIASLLAAGFFFLHGLAHAVGLKDIWGLGGEVANTATYLASLDPHSPLYALLGLAWLAALALFVGAAAGLVLRRRWWLPAALAAAGLSLVLCVVWRDAAVVGLVVDVLILAGLTAWTLVRVLRRPRGS